MADAMLEYRRNSSDSADFALINAGGIRATIDQGDITRGDILNAFPFGNSLVEVQVSGKDLWSVLEGIITGVSEFNGEEVTSFLQVSRGIKVEYNPENNNGSKLVSVTIGDSPLDLETTYNVVTLDFIAGGGDNFFAEVFDNVITLDTQDEILTQYVQSQTPVEIELDGRIAVVNGTAGTIGNGTTGNNTTTGGVSSGNGTSNGTLPGSCPPDTACTPPIYEGSADKVTIIANAVAIGFMICVFAIL